MGDIPPIFLLLEICDSASEEHSSVNLFEEERIADKNLRTV